MQSANLFDLLTFLNQKCSQTEEIIQGKLQLSRAEYRALRIVGSAEKVTCKQLSQRMRLSPSRGSRVVDRLYQKGYVNREDCHTDRRCKTVWLTRKGMMIKEKIVERLSECEKRFLDHYPAGKIEDLKKSIVELTDKI